MFGFTAYVEVLSLIKWASLIILGGFTLIVVSRKIVDYLLSELGDKDRRNS